MLPATTCSGPSAARTAIRSTACGWPFSKTAAAPAGRAGIPSMRAKSLPRPAGMIPSTPSAPATAAASLPTSPSPPTATTASPWPDASTASSSAWLRLALSHKRTETGPAESAPSTSGSIRATRPRPAAGFTTRHSASPIVHLPACRVAVGAFIRDLILPRREPPRQVPSRQTSRPPGLGRAAVRRTRPGVRSGAMSGQGSTAAEQALESGARFLQVQTTTDSRAEAIELARAAVEARLAACAQVGGPVASTYWWEEAVERAEEWLLLLKLPVGGFQALADFLDEQHSYDEPEIVAVPIVAGSDSYLNWIQEETRRA